MITISAFRDREEALISKALLEAAGVPVTLKDEFGELVLQVRDTDAQLAQEVLVSTEPVGWRGRNSKLRIARFRRGRSPRLGRQFLKGGGMAVVGFLLLLLLFIPFGIAFRVTPFLLFFLFIFGGCVALVVGSFRVREKRISRPRRSYPHEE